MGAREGGGVTEKSSAEQNVAPQEQRSAEAHSGIAPPAVAAPSQERPDVTCPFCNDNDFDTVGLKIHLMRGHCEAFLHTP